MQSFKYTRTVVQADGSSAFEDLTIALASAGPQRAISGTFSATALSFRWTPGGYGWDEHTAPRRRWVIILDGLLEVVVTSGEMRRFGVGDVLEVGDTTGRGHISRSADGRPFRSAFLNLDDEIVRAESTGYSVDVGDATDMGADKASPVDIAYARTQALADGTAHNEKGALAFEQRTRSGRVTRDIPISGFQIAYASGGLDSGWHTTGRRQIVLPLSGGMDVEAGSGPRLQIPAGGIYFSEDLTGDGHRTRAVDGQSRLAIFTHLT